MHLIVYTSKYAGDVKSIDADLNNISETAKVNNLRDEITGLLFFHRDRLVQIIEAENSSLEKLMSVLEEDSRHVDMPRLIG